MTESTKTGLLILTTAIVSGIFGNLLLRQTPWGLNAFLFVGWFAVLVFVVTQKRHPELMSRSRVALLGAMIFFGAMFVVRNSTELTVFNTIAILIIMGVLLLGALRINVRAAGALHYAAGVIWSGLVSLFGPFLLLGSDIDWREVPQTRLSRQIFSVLRGAAVALPLVLIFGALFSAADARFERFANSAINFDLNNVISHIAITSLLAWLTAGYLRGALVTPAFFTAGFAAEAAGKNQSPPSDATLLEYINRSDSPSVANGPVKTTGKTRDWQNIDSSSLPGVFTLGMIETVIILGLVDILFLIFVVMQLQYLFGGFDFVQSTPDFKLADYARRGFGELVAVAGLVLPMLMVCHWLLRPGVRRLGATYRLLAGVQIVMVFVVMASAAQRLILLTGEAGYGMTTVRFYPMVFMLWLATIFGWFAVTVLRGARQKFAWGALWSAIVILGATNLFNPDAFIAKTNIDLMKQGRPFDAGYNAKLSDDAIPELISALPQMTANQSCRVKWLVHNRYRELGETADLRSLNLARRRAFQILRRNDALMHQPEGCTTSMSNDQISGAANQSHP